MNRATWTAVFWTVVVLVAATLSTSLPWHEMAPPVAQNASLVWNREASRARAWLDERRFILALQSGGRARVPGATPAAAAAVAGAVLALAGVTVMLARRVRRPRPQVLRMAGKGESAAEIARRTGLPQDAVRLMLSPMLAPSRSGRRTGSSFRNAAAGTAGSPRSPRARVSAT
jgi:hypothetical protein